MRQKKITLSGKRTTKLYLLNPQEQTIEQIEVDGCAITEGLRCDWLVVVNDNLKHEEIYVELKGSKIDHAVEQLKTTMKRLSADRVRLAKRCLVVLNRCPMTGTDVQKHKAKFLKNFNAIFKPVRDRAEVLV